MDVVYWVLLWTVCGCGILGVVVDCVDVIYWVLLWTVWMWYTGCCCGLCGCDILGVVVDCVWM